jgi:hypothetical protein
MTGKPPNKEVYSLRDNRPTRRGCLSASARAGARACRDAALLSVVKIQAILVTIIIGGGSDEDSIEQGSLSPPNRT